MAGEPLSQRRPSFTLRQATSLLAYIVVVSLITVCAAPSSCLSEQQQQRRLRAAVCGGWHAPRQQNIVLG